MSTDWTREPHLFAARGDDRHTCHHCGRPEDDTVHVVWPTPDTEAGPERTGEPVLTARWFHVGRPWSDRPGLIYAGDEDPHQGTFVVAVDDWPDEIHFGEPQAIDVAAVAEAIVRDHNAALTPSQPVPSGLDAPSLALADMTAAYHHERKHDGHWSKCQRPRCQNARLAFSGRGPFARLTHPVEGSTESGEDR